MTEVTPRRGPDYIAARRHVAHALELARSSDPLPAAWLEATRTVGESPARTYVAALGCALLAKATDDRLDAFCMQDRAGISPDGYLPFSVRGFARVLVEDAAVHGVHLGRTGREPLQNRPFSVVLRLTAQAGVRPKLRPHFQRLLDVLSAAQRLSSAEALLALAAFFRMRLTVGDAVRAAIELGDRSLLVEDLIESLEDFLTADSESGRRGQAFVAACFDLVFPEVLTARVNDPSRHYPGDVLARDDNGGDLTVAEVRQKPIGPSDVLVYAQEAADARYPRAFVIALDPDQPAIDVQGLLRISQDRFGVSLGVILGIGETLRQALGWSTRSLEVNLQEFPTLMLGRLSDLDVSRDARENWASRFG